MEYLILVAPFLVGLAIALVLRNHLTGVGVVAGVVGALLVAFGVYDVNDEGEYAGLATLILGAIFVAWLVGLVAGAVGSRLARRFRLS